MISYNNSDVIQCLRQYEMFANSLNLVKNVEQREMIIKQLTKLEEKILALTNESYEEEYNELTNRHCTLFADEKRRLEMLIELINQRLSYVEKRCNSHYALTGESIDATEVLGANQLDQYEEKINIIDKYIKNTKLERELNEEVETLSNKIALATEKIEINKALNIELEATFIKEIAEAIEKLDLVKLREQKDEIEYAYNETEKSLTLAGQNLEMAKTSPANVLADCQEMYSEVLRDYEKYREQLCTLKLIETYDMEVSGYDELLNKRKRINEIVKYIHNQDLLDMIMDVISKQYNTIVMENQDINTCEDLAKEKERKLEALSEIEEENNSVKFQSVLKELIENERIRQEKILEEQRRIEEEEKKRRLEIERKRQEEILKRQRIIEEARKKEMEKRTKQMLEEQQNSVLQGKKKEKPVSFESIRDDSEEKAEDVIGSRYNLNMNELYEAVPEENNVDVFKGKSDIEQELWDEFDRNREEAIPVKEEETQEEDIFEDIVPIKEEEKGEENIFEDAAFVKEETKEEMNETVEDFFKQFSEREDDDIAEIDREVVENNKLPEGSLDEYMKNFDETKFKDNETIFDDDEFPSIPL